MDSVKWLVRLTLLTSIFEGHFQKNDYRLFPPTNSQAPPADIGPVRVNSLIAWPPEGAELPFGEVIRVVGYAWSGSHPVQQVEISLDGGESWKAAELTGPEARYAWRLWQFDWQPAQPGSYAVASRAVDAIGASQPLKVDWNVKGYANNSIRPIHVRVG